ncbi:Uncharacterized protein CLAVI_000284 [Candidatus Clavichlamydia salmonicola]|uniref:hypothetical protein n=1 Tax=Candidatus Clavichlamydia salmonicola TaxID=469812 RepID=UPI001891BAA8|nr:hypothetical protein [Candidatus Clavichlamydia salmonicola]MBF5050669.1 Uncharacterized protein [Candidatus Clavichlamydia salmonicola]
MSFPEEFKEDFPLFFELGFVAIRQGDELGARRLFDAAKVLNANHIAAEAGYGLSALHKMDLEQAKDHFERVIAVESENFSILSFLALTHMLISQQTSLKFEIREESLQKSVEYAAQVVENTEVETTKNLAQSVLDWYNVLGDKKTEIFR